jgi:nicotinate phosphoribosyltransferase
MSIFDGKRLTNETFKLDIERMRRGWYSDKYFENINRMLIALSSENYNYSGKFHNLPDDISPDAIAVGDIEVEMQWFTRRLGKTTVVGVDKALAMLRHCTGYFEGDTFIDTSDKIEVWAVQDGTIVKYDGDPTKVQPVIKVRGRYRDFALLETPSLGILTRSSRVATNVYETLVAANGKPVLFFPARFDVHEVQAADGYAYNASTVNTNMNSVHSSRPTRRVIGGAAQAAGQWLMPRSRPSSAIQPKP